MNTITIDLDRLTAAELATLSQFEHITDDETDKLTDLCIANCGRQATRQMQTVAFQALNACSTID